MTYRSEKRLFSTIWTSYFVLCTLAFIWPLALVANSVEPRIMGLPFLIFWCIAWVLLIFAGSLGMYIWDGRLASRRRHHA